jgi:hypothetical protein
MACFFKFHLKAGVEESIVNALYGLRISCLNFMGRITTPLLNLIINYLGDEFISF